jgi:hypothetical protein
VSAAEPVEGFTARIVFDNGVVRAISLERYLRGPIFEPIRRDPALFRAMTVSGGTVAWPNGADIDPDVLYYGLEPARAEEPDQNLEGATGGSSTLGASR